MPILHYYYIHTQYIILYIYNGWYIAEPRIPKYHLISEGYFGILFVG